MGLVRSETILFILVFSIITQSQSTGALFPGIKKPSKVIQSVVGVENRSINLNCYDSYSTGNKEPYVMWFFKNCGPGTNSSCDKLIKEGWKDEVICGYNRNGCKPTLQLKKLDFSSNGIYSCYKYRRILNFTIKGERINSYSLNVVDVPFKPPVFMDDGPTNRSVNTDDFVEFTCKVQSDLPLKFYWLKLVQIVEYEKKKEKFDNYIFEAVNATTITRLSDKVYSTSLKFPYVSVHDAGTYCCAASNDMGTIYREASLAVRECKTGFCTYPSYEEVTMSIYLILLITFCIFLNIFLLCLLKKFLNRVESKL